MEAAGKAARLRWQPVLLPTRASARMWCMCCNQVLLGMTCLCSAQPFTLIRSMLRWPHLAGATLNNPRRAAAGPLMTKIPPSRHDSQYQPFLGRPRRQFPLRSLRSACSPRQRRLRAAYTGTLPPPKHQARLRQQHWRGTFSVCPKLCQAVHTPDIRPERVRVPLVSNPRLLRRYHVTLDRAAGCEASCGRCLAPEVMVVRRAPPIYPVI